MTDISKHPILQECYELCVAIEECGASEKLTEASMKASALLESVDSLIANNKMQSDADRGCPRCMSSVCVNFECRETTAPLI